ncbi:MAG: hypothetical protein HYY26_03325 [Acidobacteria bacterium]|nr:hypothetical protein [Acidobacteriota bacterium]
MKSPNCKSYKVDEERKQLRFNDPDVTVLLPAKAERDRLRSEGTPGQLFVMKDCNSPNLLAEIKIYAEADNGKPPAEKVPCGVRVVILEEKDKWVRVKGHTSLWEGSGWVEVGDNLLVVKY